MGMAIVFPTVGGPAPFMSKVQLDQPMVDLDQPIKKIPWWKRLWNSFVDWIKVTLLRWLWRQRVH